ncbi:RING finger protein 207 isoform X1 [Chanodichthys erythropterus]|uniref:RING finger protein 207 isoform X1 n=2 Tax=Chanodichthys erythropterus TaxID=933992 RepID=UPI00351E906D
MAGEIIFSYDDLWDPDYYRLHPLVCHLCHEQYHQPCLLDCYHIFCASCLRGRANDNHLNCPLCGYPSVVMGTNALPPEDRLLRFLVDNSTDNVVQCANCDMKCKAQDAGAMYYCNTCSQPLCGECRELTHKARMFSQHDIVSLAKRTKEGHRKCSLHEELYIMFSTEKKSMLCIKCFRDMPIENRTHCIDIETAYGQGCEILDQAVLAVKELQISVREAIVLLTAMLDEVRTNAEEEERAICTQFNNIQEKLAERKKALLKAAESQHEEKEKALKEQLSNLSTLLPTLQVHLVTCSAFLGSANKYEFLDMGYQLMERLCSIVKLPHMFRPVQSSKINTDYHAEFARCLEPLLMLGQRRPGSVTGGTALSYRLSALSMSCPSTSLSEMPFGRRPTFHRYICTKVLLAEGRESPFTEHCRNFEKSYRVLQTEVQRLKDEVQEMHRDLTKHHSLINTDTMDEILERSLLIDEQIASQYSAVQTQRAVFEEIWDVTFQRVTNEQEIYEAQLHDLLQLKQENTYLTTIARQIGPYILSIAKVKERLEPRFQKPEDDRMDTIVEDNANATEQHSCNEKSCSAVCDRDSLILPPGETLLKSSDFCWKGKPINISETSCYKELPL